MPRVVVNVCFYLYEVLLMTESSSAIYFLNGKREMSHFYPALLLSLPPLV